MRRDFNFYQLKYAIFCFLCISLFKCENPQTSLHKIDSQILKENVIDTYHNKKIKDLFRSLENLEDSLVLDWLKKQDENRKKLSIKLLTLIQVKY